MQNSIMTNPSENPQNSDREIDLIDIVDFLKQGKAWIAIATVVGLLVGTSFVFLSQPEYEASTVVEMASVAGAPVESPAALVEKLKLPLYYSGQTFQTCAAEGAHPSPGEFLINELKTSPSKNGPFVNIKIKSNSVDTAKNCVEAIFADIERAQGALAKPVLDLKRAQLRELQQKLESVENLVNLLPKKNEELDFTSAATSGSALLLAVLLSTEQKRSELINQINEMQVSLAEPQTKKTSLITPVYSSGLEIKKNIGFIIVFSMILGFFSGVMSELARKALKFRR